jgi:TolA-binding protein
LILDPKGREFYRSLGFLPPERFLCHMEMGRAMVLFRTRRYEEAAGLFDTVARRDPACGTAAEAIYYRGVSLDKLTRDHSNRKVAARELAERFPDSDWTFRAEPALEEEK